jgi:hypothetical protein
MQLSLNLEAYLKNQKCFSALCIWHSDIPITEQNLRRQYKNRDMRIVSHSLRKQVRNSCSRILPRYSFICRNTWNKSMMIRLYFPYLPLSCLTLTLPLLPLPPHTLQEWQWEEVQQWALLNTLCRSYGPHTITAVPSLPVFISSWVCGTGYYLWDHPQLCV